MKVRYVGAFPPPYGGVSIKNELLFDSISNHVAIKRNRRPRFLPKKIADLLSIVLSLLPRQILIIGISASTGKSLRYTKILHLFSRANMKRSLYFMMGGVEAQRIADHCEQVRLYSNYRAVYVETEEMLNQLKKVGMKNAELYPNCRKQPLKKYAKTNENGKFRCVYFSNISKQKGADLVILAAKECPQIEFFLYGNIDEGYKTDFIHEIDKFPNIWYKGIFMGKGDDVYRELSKYDLLLFPTRWKTEGVPGVVIECKMVGVPAVLSDVSHNKELVLNEDGILFDINDPSGFIRIIKSLSEEPEKLHRMRESALKNASYYSIDTYIDDIVKRIV